MTLFLKASWPSMKIFIFFSNLVFQAGPGTLIAEVDIQSAFHILPIHPADCHPFGFQWQGLFYVDNCLPMGCSLSCALFKSFSSAIQMALQCFYGFPAMSHIFIGPQNTSICHQQLQLFLKIAAFINIPIKHPKTVFPSHIAMFHGIEIETSLVQALLPEDKLLRPCFDLSLVIVRRVRVNGSLYLVPFFFACKVIQPGHSFLHHSINAIHGISNHAHFIHG